MGFNVTFWGVRGSTSCSEPDFMVYGGNTACVELSLDGNVLILDSGSGIRGLGKKLIEAKSECAALLISHMHWDHISGFPFFAPIYSANARLDIYAVPHHKRDIRSVFEMQMSSPFFPTTIHAVPSSLHFHNLLQNEPFFLYDGSVKITPAALNHPNGATGYRIEYAGRTVAYISDTEHVAGQPDENVLKLIDGCDLMIYDALYTDDEFADYIGWGHSTWQEAVRLAKKANVRRTALFHHAPHHNDDAMAAIEKEAQSLLPSVFAAKEKMTLEL